jgi:hypothetical protein
MKGKSQTIFIIEVKNKNNRKWGLEEKGDGGGEGRS